MPQSTFTPNTPKITNWPMIVLIGFGVLVILGIIFVIEDNKDVNQSDISKKEINSEKSSSVLDPYLKEARQGMRDAVEKSYGTATMLATLPVSSAGKTGTAQTNNNERINALFTAYAPADNPEIVVLVLIENAREGSLNAIPIVRDVLDWYYWNRIAPGN